MLLLLILIILILVLVPASPCRRRWGILSERRARNHSADRDHFDAAGRNLRVVLSRAANVAEPRSRAAKRKGVVLAGRIGKTPPNNVAADERGFNQTVYRRWSAFICGQLSFSETLASNLLHFLRRCRRCFTMRWCFLSLRWLRPCWDLAASRLHSPELPSSFSCFF